MKKHIAPLTQGLTGRLRIPGDKSVSHRSVMFSALGSTPVRITNFLHAADCLSTVACMKALGADVQMVNDTELIVTGHGLHGLQEPACILDAGNSGTTLRLLMGLLAPQPFLATFTGDASLSKRPMGRVIKPLSQMGAKIVGRKDNTLLPITVCNPGKKLHGMTYESPVASAQVKSAILLAGMFADAPTTVVEPVTSRDHTEKMLAAFGVPTEKKGTAVTICPVADDAYVAPASIEVPGDISSAAYWLVLASLVPGSRLVLENVGTNITRTGILDVLEAMGANIVRENVRTSGGEDAADLVITAAKLHGTTFGKDLMPRLIDEIPAIAVAALFAEGDTVITGAGELRVKETDRLQAIADEWNKVAPGSVEAGEDSLVIHGGTPVQCAEARSYDDHRMAMSLAILGAAGQGVIIDRPDCVNISYPVFYDTFQSFMG
ncbi:3-phosphoshikimate 1-carboxyvinyltransferase [uncultured Selenomonas sp.]|uniref:3-phosphoshikimate 1-carboxyvinyltransferase n=1 Tax=uncultured Selenomonas sp. TaxID=159275 RepID=UPI0025EE3B9B|nr:3-phosphoshikimate 1-carboxyvinyltransferase [uncultured Selenomonas sp.]